jgi:hypothetical protein
MSSTNHIFKLSPGIQSYDWGKIGKSSLAAQFGEICLKDEEFHVDEDKAYAEVRNTGERCSSSRSEDHAPVRELFGERSEHSSPSRSEDHAPVRELFFGERSEH